MKDLESSVVTTLSADKTSTEPINLETSSKKGIVRWRFLVATLSTFLFVSFAILTESYFQQLHILTDLFKSQPDCKLLSARRLLNW